MHQNRVQNIIHYHDINILKQMCIKTLCLSTETYIWYYVKGGNIGWYFHYSSTSWIGLIPKKLELFLLCTIEWDQRGHLGLEFVLTGSNWFSKLGSYIQAIEFPTHVLSVHSSIRPIYVPHCLPILHTSLDPRVSL